MIHKGDVLEVLSGMRTSSFDGGFCDPPYGLSFMGKAWDKGVPGVETWRELYRVLKPGAYLLAFGGTRTFHRLTCAIEDGGFEIRDCIMWLYGSGFPKAKSCLKPAYEPVILARKRGPMLPLAIDACRIGTEVISGSRSASVGAGRERSCNVYDAGNGKTPDGRNLAAILERQKRYRNFTPSDKIGRWPANVILDEEAGAALDAQSGTSKSRRGHMGLQYSGCHGGIALSGAKPKAGTDGIRGHDDSGGAARFFYCAKASPAERGAGLEGRTPQTVSDGRKKSIDNPYQRGETPRLNTHPTVKPLKLTEYLARLILPAGGGKLIVPFSGSGSEMLGGKRAGWKVTGIELNPDYIEIAEARLKAAA